MAWHGVPGSCQPKNRGAVNTPSHLLPILHNFFVESGSGKFIHNTEDWCSFFFFFVLLKTPRSDTHGRDFTSWPVRFRELTNHQSFCSPFAKVTDFCEKGSQRGAAVSAEELSEEDRRLLL